MDAKELMSGGWSEQLYSNQMSDDAQKTKEALHLMWTNLSDSFLTLKDSFVDAWLSAVKGIDLKKLWEIVLYHQQMEGDCRVAIHYHLVDRRITSMALGKCKVKWRTSNKNMNRVRRELRIHERRSTPAGQGKRWVKKGTQDESHTGIIMEMCPDTVLTTEMDSGDMEQG